MEEVKLMKNKKKSGKDPISYYAVDNKNQVYSRVPLQLFSLGVWLVAELYLAITIFRSTNVPEPTGYVGTFIVYSLLFSIVFAVVVIFFHIGW